MQVDYIIVGQGIAGTFLSWYLHQAGTSVVVIDEPIKNSASKVASGVINPVTGRRIVRTWMIETLLPFAYEAYTQLGQQIGAEVITQTNILDFHPTPQMMLAFKDRLPEEKEYLRLPADETQYQQHFQYYFGLGEIDPCYLVNTNKVIEGWKKILEKDHLLLEEHFDIEHLITNSQGIEYKHLKAKKIIFCDGAAGTNNPFFQLLPYAKNKGEAIIATIDGLPRNNIYKQGITLVPWQENQWWIGSTYEWDFKDLHPTPAFRDKVTQQLQTWLRLPFTLSHHMAAERPANLERRPFVGFHPVHTHIGILNGLGTKGCSLAPYFAHQLAENLLYQKSILPQADVSRFTKILTR